MQRAVDALSYVEQAMAVVPLFDSLDLRTQRPGAELKMPETREDGVMPVRRRLSYTDEGQGVLPCHNLR